MNELHFICATLRVRGAAPLPARLSLSLSLSRAAPDGCGRHRLVVRVQLASKTPSQVLYDVLVARYSQ